MFSASHGTEYAGHVSSREGVRLCVVKSQHSASGSAAAIVRLMAILIKPVVLKMECFTGAGKYCVGIYIFGPSSPSQVDRLTHLAENRTWYTCAVLTCFTPQYQNLVLRCPVE